MRTTGPGAVSAFNPVYAVELEPEETPEGQRWAGAHLDDGYLTVDRTILQIGGMVAGGKPKSKAGERRIWLGSGTVALLKAHRRALLADQLRASSAWADNDLIFCRADGSPWPPIWSPAGSTSWPRRPACP